MRNRPTSVSRRDFLKTSAASLGAAVAAPLLIPSGVLAAPGRPGANDRVGVAGIGVGRQGSAVLSWTVGQKDAQIVAVADVNIKRAREIGATYQAEPYQDYRKLLERKDVDAVISATPEHWRTWIALHACQAGKDMYIEKPMSLTIREGRLMVDAATKHGRIFQIGSMQRSMAPNRLGCELVRNGRIGKIKRVIAHNYPSPWGCKLPEQPVPEGLDWEMWCGPNPIVPYNLDLYTPRANPGWISFRPYSGGEMTGWGSHGLDQVQWALGMDRAGPIEAWTEGAEFEEPIYTKPESRKRGEKLCSHPKVFFRYPGDIVVELGNGPAGGAIFVGEKGTITIDRNVCKSDPPEIAKTPIKDGEIHLTKSDNHVRNWLDCIKSREQPICCAETGHRSSSVCHLGNIARWTGRKLRWDPAKEVFPDDDAANEFLRRPQRKGYELPEKA